MLDPREMPISQALLDCVPRSLVFEMTILPIADDGQTVTLLCCNDDAEFRNLERDRLEFLLSRKIEWWPVDRNLLEESIYNRFPLANAEVINCDPKFRFKCPRNWKSLTLTDLPRVRHCEQCGRLVTWTDDSERAKRLGLKNECVAFSNARGGETLGMIDAD